MDPRIFSSICVADAADVTFCLVCCGKCEWSETGNTRVIGQLVHMLAFRFLGCVTRLANHPEMLMSDETWDKLVKRSRIIYSVIHFTSPCSECKLPQSFYFKPSFPTWGCRLPSLLPISLTFPARCPGGTVHPEIRSVCCYSCRFPRWPAAPWFYLTLRKTCVFFYSLCTCMKSTKLNFRPHQSIFRPPWPISCFPPISFLKVRHYLMSFDHKFIMLASSIYLYSY